MKYFSIMMDEMELLGPLDCDAALRAKKWEGADRAYFAQVRPARVNKLLDVLQHCCIMCAFEASVLLLWVI